MKDRRVLVGREPERALVADRLVEGGFLVVVGEAGVGKTALVESVAAVAQQRLVPAGAFATLNRMPYLPLTRALGHAIEQQDQAAVAVAVAAAVGSDVLFLDDLQWADAATLEVIEFLAPLVRLIATVRAGDPRAPAALDAAAAAGAERLELTGLDDQAARTLILSNTPDASEQLITQILRRAGGNPLLIAELTSSPGSSTSLREAVMQRVDALSARSRSTVRELALLGRPATLDEVGPAIEELVSAELVVVSHDGVVPRHALIGDAVLADVDQTSRSDIRAQLAGRSSDPADAARLFLAAGQDANAHQRALEALDLANDPNARAQALSLAALSAPPASSASTRFRAATALRTRGLHEGIRELMAPLLTDPDPATRAEARFFVAFACMRENNTADGKAALDQALADVPSTAIQLRARILTTYAELPVAHGWDPKLAREHGTRAYEAAVAAGEGIAAGLVALARGLATEAAPEAADAVQRALAAARQEGDFDAELDCLRIAVAEAAFAGDMTESMHLCRSAAVSARDHGRLATEFEFRTLEATTACLSGQPLRDSERQLQALLGAPIPVRHRDLLLGLLALVRADLGNPDEASAMVDRALAPGRANPKSRATLLWLRAEIELVGGRPRAAAASIEACGKEIAPEFPLFFVAPLVRSWALAGLKQAPGPPLPDCPFAIMAGSRPESEGLIALSTGRHPDAAELFTAAAHAWSGQMHRNSLRCEWAAAESWRLAGEPERAVTLLLELEASAEQLGAAPTVGLVRQSLRRLGVPRTVRAARSPARVTERERQALDLVGAGLRSTEIAARLGITPSTVDDIVESAMRKLGASTRLQAAALITTAHD